MLRLLAMLSLATLATAQNYYSIALDGAQEVPPVATAARGFGVLRHDTATNDVRLWVWHTGITSPLIAAHLHQGAVGVNGGVMFALAQVAPDTWTANVVVSPAQAAALAANSTYVNVHTNAFGTGEIRGQVVPATSTRFTGTLSGAQEVPPVPTAATGTAVAYLHQPENRVVYMIDTVGLANVQAAHFHQGPAGANGGVQIVLNGAGGTYCGVSQQLTAAQVAAWLANGVYVNVHTAAFATGEIRGQMIKDLGDHWSARLDGLQEVPPTPSPGFGSGSVLVTNNTITVQGEVTGLLAPPAAAHIHLGLPGTNGGVVFPLALAGNSFGGTFTATTAQLADLRAGRWYFNVHTAAFGTGEIRGQLGPAKIPTTFGFGCPGSNGVRPQAGATGMAVLGTALDLDLYGAIPGAPVAFAFGPSRDSFAATPLPIELPVLGFAAPECFLFVEASILVGNATNGFGCAKQPIQMPVTASLRGATGYAQWFILDPGAPGGLVASSAVSLAVQ
jgi:hypothetical protein